MPKNKLLLACYVALIVFLSVSNSFVLFFAVICAAFVFGGARRGVLLSRALKGVAFFTGFTLVGSVVGAFMFGHIVELQKIAVLFFRSFSIAFLTLVSVDRIGILNLFGFSDTLTLFFAMLFSKIETLSKEIEDFKDAARSRGMRVSFKDATALLSIVITAVLLKSMEGSKASFEALKSRGYGA